MGRPDLHRHQGIRFAPRTFHAQDDAVHPQPCRDLPPGHRQPRRRRPVDGWRADARPCREHELLRRVAHSEGLGSRPGPAANLGNAGPGLRRARRSSAPALRIWVRGKRRVYYLVDFYQRVVNFYINIYYVGQWRVDHWVA